VDANHRNKNDGSTDSPGANRNATRKRRGPGGAKGRMPGVIHLPPPVSRGARRFNEVDCEPPIQDDGSTDSPGANRNATRKRRGPGGAKGRMPGVIHLPPPVQLHATEPKAPPEIARMRE
jgi:hypothetical protein